MFNNTITNEQLVKLLKNEIAQYAGFSFTSEAYTLFDDEQQRYAVVVVPNLPRPYPSRVAVMARVKDNKIFIDEDITDKPLADALITNADIPRDRIILVYEGEA